MTTPLTCSIVHRSRSWRLVALVAVVAMTVGVLGTLPASARVDRQTLAERQRENRRQQAEVAASLDVLRAEQADVEAALDALEANTAAERAAFVDAENAVAVVQRALESARADEAAAQEQLRALDVLATETAVEAFVTAGSRDSTLWASTNVNDFATRDAYLDVTTTSKFDLIDQLRAARAGLADARQAVDDAAALAVAQRDKLAERLAASEAARAAQQAVADAVQERVERRLAESANLVQFDKQLAQEIAAAEKALSERAGAGSRSSSRSSTSASTSSGGVAVRKVKGFVVHVDIADQVEAMISQAEAEGHHFGGGAYRDPADQRRLRRQNCPSASSPPARCRPPTARPGQSMHEQGKAIDFTYNGRLIQSRSNPGYRWLAANAGRYGFKNLPSEPWHWSTNGR